MAVPPVILDAGPASALGVLRYSAPVEAGEVPLMVTLLGPLLADRRADCLTSGETLGDFFGDGVLRMDLTGDGLFVVDFTEELDDLRMSLTGDGLLLLDFLEDFDNLEERVMLLLLEGFNLDLGVLLDCFLDEFSLFLTGEERDALEGGLAAFEDFGVFKEDFTRITGLLFLAVPEAEGVCFVDLGVFSFERDWDFGVLLLFLVFGGLLGVDGENCCIFGDEFLADLLAFFTGDSSLASFRLFLVTKIGDFPDDFF